MSEVATEEFDLRALYLDRQLSIPQISALIGVNRSAARKMLLTAGIRLRTPAEGMRLRIGDIAAANRGKKRSHTAETRLRIRAAAISRGERTAKGFSHKSSGYVEHTRGIHKGRSVHVVTMEEIIGRHILPDEVVHHIDHDRSNNAPENLRLMKRTDHTRLHRLEELAAQQLRERNDNGRFR